MVFLGVDWAEEHHDAWLENEQGEMLGKARIANDVGGVRQLHELVAEHADDPSQVVVGIETDRGLLVAALVGAGYQIYAVNPLSVSRYRDRHKTSGAKSDRADAKLLADLVRTDRHNHRPLAGDSDLSEAIKVLARAHQDLVWTRKRFINRLRSALGEFYPAALEAFETDLGGLDAIAVLERAPTPWQGRQLSQAKIVSALRKAGRQRYLEHKAAEIQRSLRSEQLQAPSQLQAAMATVVSSCVAMIKSLNLQLEQVGAEMSASFKAHPDAEIYLSLPGLGVVLSARVLGEFGDDRARFADAKARKAYAGTAPVTQSSGTKKIVLARFARNRRLGDACYWWAFSSLTCSPGANHYYRALRTRGKTHHQALRGLANRLVGILHACLAASQTYSESVAWPQPQKIAA